MNNTEVKPIDDFEVDLNDPIIKMFLHLPFAIDWVNFKGEDVVAQINWESTKKAHKPMLDISYCMTKALNQYILFTTQWDKNKFKPSRLGNSKW
jgi:hypothetical protein